MDAKEAIGIFSDSLLLIYNGVKQELTPGWGLAFDVVLLIAGITIASAFVWYFYASLSQRSLLRLDLYKYNKSSNPGLRKFMAIILFFIEYLLVMPFILILWFAALSIMLLLINEKYNTSQVLMVSAAVVGAIRVLAYYNKDAAEEVAKLVPFTAMALFLLSSISVTFSQMLSRLEEVPLLLDNIAYFILVIVVVEVILRGLYTINHFLESQDELKRHAHSYPYPYHYLGDSPQQ
jgi:hypothetical protein